MQWHWKRISIFIGVIVAGAGVTYLWQADYLTIDFIRTHQAKLFEFIGRHYVEAVFCYILFYLATALFLPGALILTITGGMLFGTMPAVVYANIGATLGSLLAFAISRHIIGRWFQARFEAHMKSFKNELARHGPNYLLTLRILPLVPFFVVNYGAGFTNISLATFVWTTSLGVLPGSIIYSYFGSRLRDISQAENVFSWKIILALVLLALFALLPVILHHSGIRKKHL